jgi:uncharacterized protein YjbI with pentapeptide repeats
VGKGTSSSPRRSSPRTGSVDVVPPDLTKRLSAHAGIGDSSDDEDTLIRDDDDDDHIAVAAAPDVLPSTGRRNKLEASPVYSHVGASHDGDVSAALSESERESARPFSRASPSTRGHSRNAWPPSPSKSRHWRAARRSHATPVASAVAAAAAVGAAAAAAAPVEAGAMLAAPADTPRASDGGEASSEMWTSGKASIVELNVGGQYFATSSTTIAMHKESLLYKLVFGRIASTRDAQNRIFIDRDGAVFRYVLNFMRDGRLSLPMNFDDYEALLWAAEFYQVRGLRHAALAQLAQVRRERLVRFLSLAGLDLSHAPLQGVDFEGMSLCGMNLSGAVLEGANLREADLRGADLRGAQLQGACLDGALLDDANLQKADLKQASLVGASLVNARFDSVVAAEVRFTDALMTGTVFCNANLMRTVFDNCGLAGCDLRGANLSDSSMDGANVSECCFADATLIGTRLRSANARAVDLKGALIRDVSFESAVLVGAVFDEARVERCAFSRANMATCSLRFLDLRGSVFGGKGDIGAATNLNHSDLTNAQLQGVNLRGVSLEGSNLSNANFTGADTSGVKLQGAHRINTIGLKKS